MKRFYLKRGLKRSILDSFTRDDPTAFGYDKRAFPYPQRKRSIPEDLTQEEQDRKKKSL